MTGHPGREACDSRLISPVSLGLNMLQGSASSPHTLPCSLSLFLPLPRSSSVFLTSTCFLGSPPPPASLLLPSPLHLNQSLIFLLHFSHSLLLTHVLLSFPLLSLPLNFLLFLSPPKSPSVSLPLPFCFVFFSASLFYHLNLF